MVPLFAVHMDRLVKVNRTVLRPYSRQHLDKEGALIGEEKAEQEFLFLFLKIF